MLLDGRPLSNMMRGAVVEIALPLLLALTSWPAASRGGVTGTINQRSIGDRSTP